MSDHAFQPIERHCDVAVVGGSAAGLAAALQLGRQRRSVIVIDAGEPRNVPAADEVRRHGGEILAGGVSAPTRTDDGRIRPRPDGLAGTPARLRRYRLSWPSRRL